MQIELDGRARKFGDDINTDYIIASTRKRDTLDNHVLKRYLFETVDPAFAASVQSGDLLVAGSNFGCGSAMEIAATVILAADVKAVLARTFNRTFYRNAINNGLIPIECDTTLIREGDRLSIVVSDGAIEARNLTTGVTLAAKTLPALMTEILSAGGIIDFVKSGALSSRGMERRDTRGDGSISR